eukprot:339807-Amphidinium_carterae.1
MACYNVHVQITVCILGESTSRGRVGLCHMTSQQTARKICKSAKCMGFPKQFEIRMGQKWQKPDRRPNFGPVLLPSFQRLWSGSMKHFDERTQIDNRIVGQQLSLN